MTSTERSAFAYATIVAMGGFVFGLDAALISGTVNFITKEFGLTDWQLGTAVSAPGFGVLVALPFVGLVCNKLGRKLALQIIAALYLVSAVWSAFAPDFWNLVAARFLGGLAFSSIALASMYIGEIAPPKWRGKLVSMTQINIVLGLSGAYFVNYLILKSTNSGAHWVEALGITRFTWRWMLGSEILPALLWLALLFTIPESPYWLVYANRLEEAKRNLKRILPVEQIDHHLDEMRQSMKSGGQDHTIVQQMRLIFGRPMRLIFVIAITIAIAQQSTGINAILFYAPTVIEQLGIGTDAAFMQSVWIGLTSVVFTIAGLLLVDRLGRRPLIIGGMVWIIISLLACSYGFKTARYVLTPQAISELAKVPDASRLNVMADKEYPSDIAFKRAVRDAIGDTDARDHASLLLQKSARMPAALIFAGILSFIAAFHFSVGPVMWVLFSEIFPIAVRGIAIPFFTLITSLTSYLVQQFFPWQLATMGVSSIFLFYAITVGLGLVILYFYLVETKNMSIEEIQLALLPRSLKGAPLTAGPGAPPSR
jgi:SP family arabinose:H+ symporter-like MFS transporter